MNTVSARFRGGTNWRGAGLTAAAILAMLLAAGCHKAVTNPVLPAVPREAFAKPWAGQKVFLIGIGDSVTAGFGATEGHSYFDMLVKNAPDDGDDVRGACLSNVWPGIKPVNLAMSYSTSAEHLDYQVARMGDASKDVFGVVVITTGGNDVIHDYGRTPPRDGAMYGATLEQAKPWIGAFEKRLAAILDGIEGHFPGGCEIFLANIYDPTDGAGDIENAGLGLPRWPDGLKVLESVNGVIARAASSRKNVHLVNIRETFLGHGTHYRDKVNPYHHADDPSYWYYENLEDPNDTGYNAIRRLFLAEMAKVFAGREAPAAQPGTR